jgi:fumarate hydratase class I
VVGGTSAEFALKTAKYASAKYLDTLPAQGSAAGHGFRDRELEEQVLGITRRIGIGAQFGGKYFCHDVRVIRLPRHGASCPVAIAVSCSADRQALGKITADGVFLEQLETDPAQYLPDEVADDAEVVAVDLNQPMDAIRAELTRYPVRTRVSLTGPLVVARDIAHAKIAERLDAGEPMPSYLRDHPVYYAGRRLAGHAGQGQPVRGRDGRVPAVRRVLPRLDRRGGGPAGPGLHYPGRRAGIPRARDGSRVEDRGP